MLLPLKHNVSRMRGALAFIPMLFLAGCSTQRPVQPYVYSPPVVVAFKDLQRTNDYFVAAFTIRNVGAELLWFDGEARDHPACCIEYRSMPVAEHSPGGIYWGDTGLGRYRLAPGESSEFQIVRQEFAGPFRVGVWLSPEADNKTQNDLIYWSDFVSP